MQDYNVIFMFIPNDGNTNTEQEASLNIKAVWDIWKDI